MNRLNALRQKQGETHDKMEALLAKASEEKREMTEIEVTVFDDLQKEYDLGKAAIEREEAVEKTKADLAKPITPAGSATPKAFATPKVRYVQGRHG